MKEIKKIIWATDGSKESEEALGYAVFLAKEFGSEITGIHVAPMLVPTPERVLSESEFQIRAAQIEQNIGSRLAEIVDELASREINFQGIVLEGEPYNEIIQFADRENADLVVMGKRGLGIIDKLLTGSTTLKVLRESRVPILAVKKRDGENKPAIRHILVPLDITEPSDSAFIYAIDLAEKVGAEVSVVHVFTLLDAYAYQISPGVPDAAPMATSPAVFDALEDSVKISSDSLAKRVKEAKLRCGASNLEITAEVVQGTSPAAAIADYASEKDIDLIVINTGGKKGMERFFLGSVTEKVIQESPCPVLALRL